jgi:hypothetical protein
MIEKPYTVSVTPPDSAGGLGRQLLAAIKLNAASAAARKLFPFRVVGVLKRYSLLSQRGSWLFALT